MVTRVLFHEIPNECDRKSTDAKKIFFFFFLIDCYFYETAMMIERNPPIDITLHSWTFFFKITHNFF